MSPGFFVGVQLIGPAGRGRLLLLVLSRQVARGFLERCAIEELAVEQVALEGLGELQGAPHADAEGVDAGLEALQVAAPEDAGEGLLPALLELVSGDAGFLVGLELVGGEPEVLYGGDDFVVDAAVGGLQVIADRLQPALRPGNLPAVDHGLGVVLADEGPGSPDDHLFEQVEQGRADFAIGYVASCIEEESVEVADAGAGEVAAVAAGDQGNLVVEVEDVVVDGRCGEENQLLAAAVPAPAGVGADNALQVLIALGGTVAEVVGLVDQDYVGVSGNMRGS